MRLHQRIARAAAVFFRGYDAAGITNRWPPAAIMRAPHTEALAARGTLGQRAAYLRAPRTWPPPLLLGSPT